MIDELDKKILKKIKRNLVSGQQLATELSITRTAVWKRINKLKQLGYKIKSTPKGYLLLEEGDLLLEEEVKPLLSTSLIGKRYIYLQNIDSTNNYAKQNILEEGTVVVAQKQTSGKGRKNRKWISTGKGLYFSIVLKPPVPITELMRFSLIFPYSITKTVEKFTDLNPQIKWPNDVYLNNKKLSGILLESEIEAEKINKLIVGIGLNVNDTQKDLKQLSDIATSMYIETGKTFSKKEVFAFLLNEIENVYIKYISDLKFRKDLLSYIDRKLLWKGEKVILVDQDKKIEGTLIGIDESGSILIKEKNKTTKVYSGDLSLRKKDV